MEKIKFKIYTLGCKVNQYDSSQLENLLLRQGMIKVKTGADLAVINSCAVTKKAQRKSRQILVKAKKENPQAKIILAGCWPRVEKINIKKIPADLIFNKKDPVFLIEEINKMFGFKNKIIKDRKQVKIKFNPNKSRFFLKIQDGCNQFCSYCIIPYARGELKSKPFKQVLAEIKQAVEAGYREIVLCGIHLGLYGVDLPRPENLLSLLKAAIKIENLGRIRLSSIEAAEIDDELIDLIANTNKICRHLHIPLQSGSDKILKLMNRPYNVKYFADKIKKIRQKIPDIAITTDIIVGFPGETAKDFDKTYAFVKKMKFSRLHIFPFSAHKITPASKMSRQISSKEIKSRTDELRRIGIKMEAGYKKNFIGKELDVVVERQKGRLIKGKSEYYFDVEARAKINRNLVGKIIKAKLCLKN